MSWARHIKRLPLCLGKRKGRVLRLVILATPKTTAAPDGSRDAASPEATPKVAKGGEWIN